MKLEIQREIAIIKCIDDSNLEFPEMCDDLKKDAYYKIIMHHPTTIDYVTKYYIIYDMDLNIIGFCDKRRFSFQEFTNDIVVKQLFYDKFKLDKSLSNDDIEVYMENSVKKEEEKYKEEMRYE